MSSRMACLLESSLRNYNEHTQGHNPPHDAFKSHRSGLKKHVWKTSSLKNHLLDYSWLHVQFVYAAICFHNEKYSFSSHYGKKCIQYHTTTNTVHYENVS